MATVNRLVTYEGIPIWRHARVIEWALQVVSGVVIVALLVWFFSNNLLLQKLTTRQPDDDQIEVAATAMRTALEADGEVAGGGG